MQSVSRASKVEIEADIIGVGRLLALPGVVMQIRDVDARKAEFVVGVT